MFNILWQCDEKIVYQIAMAFLIIRQTMLLFLNILAVLLLKKGHLRNWQPSSVNMCVTKTFSKRHVVENVQNYFPFKRKDN